MMKTRHVDYPRSAVIVFRLYFRILPISQKASYADSRTLYGLGCPPHTHSHSGGSGALRTTRPTVSSVEKPTVFGTTIGISFQSVLFSSFHCLVTDLKMQNQCAAAPSIVCDVNSENLSACLRSKSSKYSWKDLNPDESSFFHFPQFFHHFRMIIHRFPPFQVAQVYILSDTDNRNRYTP